MSGPYFTEEWLKEYEQKRCGNTHDSQTVKPSLPGKNTEAPLVPEKPKQKYGNRKTECDGITFDSKHEAQQYGELQLRLKAGEIRGLLLQIRFTLPGGIQYIADFVTLNNDGTYTVLDAKSEATRKDKVYRLKKRLMRECLNIEIQEV